MDARRQFGFIFDTARNEFPFPGFQCCDFSGESVPNLSNPARHLQSRKTQSSVTGRSARTFLKAFFIDLRIGSSSRTQASEVRSWRPEDGRRKNMPPLILSTQSLDELRRSDMIEVIIEAAQRSGPRQPRHGSGVVPPVSFISTENEVGLLSHTIPKQQFPSRPPRARQSCQPYRSHPHKYWLYHKRPSTTFDVRKNYASTGEYRGSKG